MMRIWDDWLLLPERLAIHEPSATAVLADLHLGYGEARRRLGDAIPCRAIADELAPLRTAAVRCHIRAVVVAGDLFERGFDPAIYREWLGELDRLKMRFAGLVPGNHDRIPPDADVPILPDGYELAGWRIRHGDKEMNEERVICGHWHPAVRVNGRKRPCFLVRGWSLILPAFSLDAAGADVDAEPRWRGWDRHIVQVKSKK